MTLPLFVCPSVCRIVQGGGPETGMVLEEDADSTLDVLPAMFMSVLDSWRLGGAELLLGKPNCTRRLLDTGARKR